MHATSFRRAAGWCFLAGGLLPLLCLPLLALHFGYPDIIRAEPSVLLPRLHAQRHLVPYLYYAGVGGMGLSLLFGARFLQEALETEERSPWTAALGLAGTLSGVFLFAGILRYALLFPRLAAWRAGGAWDPGTVDLVFRAFNTYAGETLAEHIQFLFSTIFLASTGIAGLRTRRLPRFLAWAALGVACVIGVGNLEFFGVPGTFAWNRLGAKLFGIWEVLAGLCLLGWLPRRGRRSLEA